MSASTVDYGRLMQETKPQVIHDEELNRKYIARLEELDSRWDRLTPDERKLHELLVLLIQDFEKRSYKIRRSKPIEALRELMDANGLRNKDLVGIFATESIVSEVLNGKRAMTVEHVRKLARRFAVSADVFV